MVYENGLIYEPGKKIEKFTIKKLLGRSIHGVTYLTEENKVLKNLYKDIVEEAIENLEDFLQIDHPHLLKIENLIEFEDRLFFQYSYEPLNLDLIIKQNLPIEENLRLILAIVSSLKKLHNDNIYHGNLKPTNIIIGKNQHILFSDFKLPFILPDDFSNCKIDDFAFSSPEQFEKKWVDKETDYFSLGSLLYLLFCKKYPFGRIEDIEEYIYNIMVKEPEYQKEIVPNFKYNNELLGFINGLLNKDSEKRGEVFLNFEKWLFSEELKSFITEKKHEVAVKTPTPVFEKKEIFKIGNFEVIETLGVGAFAKVYLGKNINGNEKVAIKILNKEKQKDRTNIDFFIAESETLKMISHPNIVKWIDYFDNEKAIVMEYAEGENIHTIIMRLGILPYEYACPIIYELCLALKYLHSNNILHLDIKPSNVIISPDGKLKLIDFGLAGVNKFCKNRKNKHLMGTLNFMSPEQIFQKDVDETSDLYSVGALFYRLITGRNAYYADSLAQKREKFASNDLVYPNQIIKSIPKDVAEMIVKLLKVNPRERYQKVEDFLSDFEKIESSREKLDTICVSLYSEYEKRKKAKLVIPKIKKSQVKKITGSFKRSSLLQNLEDVKEKKEKKYWFFLFPILIIILTIFYFWYFGNNLTINFNLPSNVKLENIYVNGKNYLRENKLKIKRGKTYNLEVKVPGYFPEEKRIVYDKGGNISLVLSEPKNFLIHSNYSEKYFILKEYSKEPLEIERKYFVPPGNYTLTYNVSGFEPFEMRINVSSESPFELFINNLKELKDKEKIKLMGSYDMLLLSVKDENGNIYSFQGPFSFSNPLFIELNSGNYFFKIKENFPEGRTKDFKVKVEKGCKVLKIFWENDIILCK